MSYMIPDIPGYEMGAEIGRGGMGVVYRVLRRTDGMELALKIILHGRGASFTEFARFRIEAEALACLNHPNIVKIRDVGLFEGFSYFAMEYAGRGSLKEAISGRPQNPRWSADVVRTVALAMQHAHDRGMLHRDLKPANLLLMEDATLKVSDFGLVKFSDPIRKVSEAHCTFSVSELDMELSRYARELSVNYRSLDVVSAANEEELTNDAWEECAARTKVLVDGAGLRSVQEFLSEARHQPDSRATSLDGLTEVGSIMGSPSYMAPEQAMADLANIGPRTDVYALGGILYELLTGRPPYGMRLRRNPYLNILCAEPPLPQPTVRQCVPELSGDIEAVCMKCLEKSPDARYRSAADLAEDLSRYLDGYSTRAVVWPALGESLAIGASTEDVPPTKPPNIGTTSQRRTKSRWWPFA